MLTSLMKEHAVQQQQQREHVDRLRKEALDAVAGFTNATVNGLNTSVSEAYYNQRKIDAESRALQAKVAKFRQQTTQWLKLVESLRTSLRELGDVQSWAHAMQQDLEIVNDTLELAYTSEQERRMQRNLQLQTTPLSSEGIKKLSSDATDDPTTPTATGMQSVTGKNVSTASFSTASTISAPSTGNEPNPSMTQSQTSSYGEGMEQSSETLAPSSESPPPPVQTRG